MHINRCYSQILHFSRSCVLINPSLSYITRTTLYNSSRTNTVSSPSSKAFSTTGQSPKPSNKTSKKSTSTNVVSESTSSSSLNNVSSSKTFSLGTITASDDGIRFDRYMQLSFLIPEKESTDTPVNNTKNNNLVEIPIALLQRLARQKVFYVQKSDGTISSTHITCSTRLSQKDTIIVNNPDIYKLFTNKSKYNISTSATNIVSSGSTIGSSTSSNSDNGASKPPPTPTSVTITIPPWIRTSIKYIDKDIIIISKPTGIASQPGGEENTKSNPSSSLTTYLPIYEQVLNQYNPEKHNLSSVNSLFYNVISNYTTRPNTITLPISSTDEGERLRVVHRLDKDVSGLLIIARSREAAAKLSHHFSLNSTTEITNTSSPDAPTTPKIRKRYFGISLSPIPTNKDTVYDELGRIQGICRTPVTRTEWDNDGKILDQISWSAETQWLGTTIQSTVPKVQSSPTLSLFSLEPITGRRHQLRQHVYSILKETNGLLGDTKYRNKNNNTIPSYITAALGSNTNTTIPIMLHSYRLTIPAGLLGPHQQRSISIEDELPIHIRSILQLYSVSSRTVSEIIEGNNSTSCSAKK